MTWTVPNMLTVFRILAAPGVALAFVLFERPAADWVALILFVTAALTDFLDGWLARRLNQITDVGKMLDPIADKAMVIIALMVLVARPPYMADTPAGKLPVREVSDMALVAPAALIMLREVMVSGLREYLGDVKLPVTALAKWKTTVQMVAIGVLLAAPLLLGAVPDAGTAGLGLLWLAAILTLITGWDYFRKGLAYIRRREDG